jgi:hypothetical protein
MSFKVIKVIETCLFSKSYIELFCVHVFQWEDNSNKAENVCQKTSQVNDGRQNAL